MSEYYAFVAGLPDLVFDERKKIFTIQEYREELDKLLAGSDKKNIKKLLLKQDNDNLLSYLRHNGEKEEFDEIGLFSSKDIAAMVEEAKDDDVVAGMEEAKKRKWKRKYPEYILQFLTDYFGKEEQSPIYMEDHLSGLYHNYLRNTNNEFLRTWSELNMNIRNTLTALSCRRNGMEYADLIVGDNEVAQLLRTSTNPSHNLMELIDYFESIRNIDEKRDILEKEQAIDHLLWNWLEENTFFHYFDIEKIMAYLFKLQIIERWRNLDKGRGEAIFREIVSDLKKGITKLENFEN
ncbi:MAG: DUF2764 domain-containing protein [Bacteroidales bacterium]|jgi:hypothetical protein|nr:DUF2764 domain-containing protein [Bacteroidales bacterium]